MADTDFVAAIQALINRARQGATTAVAPAPRPDTGDTISAATSPSQYTPFVGQLPSPPSIIAGSAGHGLAGTPMPGVDYQAGPMMPGALGLPQSVPLVAALPYAGLALAPEAAATAAGAAAGGEGGLGSAIAGGALNAAKTVASHPVLSLAGLGGLAGLVGLGQRIAGGGAATPAQSAPAAPAGSDWLSALRGLAASVQAAQTPDTGQGTGRQILGIQQAAQNLMQPQAERMAALMSANTAGINTIVDQLPAGYQAILKAYLPQSDNLAHQLATAYQFAAQTLPYAAQQKMLTQADLARIQGASAVAAAEARGYDAAYLKAQAGGTLDQQLAAQYAAATGQASAPKATTTAPTTIPAPAAPPVVVAAPTPTPTPTKK